MTGRKAMATQVCAWTAAALLMADIGSRAAFEKPLPKFSLPVYSQFMQSSAKPDVLVVGSSVALCASFCADETLKKLSQNRKDNYTDALYLQKQLKAKTGQDLNCRTLATAGAMASDAWMLVSKAIEFDKKPKVIIYETVSRDLFDASMPQIGDTPIYRELASLHPETKNSTLPKYLVEVFDNLQRSPVVTALNITFADTRFLTEPERLQFCVDSIASSLFYTYKSRTANRDWLTDKLCALLNRKSSIYESAQAALIKKKQLDPYAPLTAFQVDSRPQEKRYENELVYFEKLIKICKQNSIELVVVFLPVNKQQYGPKVPPELRKRYPADSAIIAKKHNVRTLDYSSDTSFNPSNFADHVHLNSPGAVKLTNKVANDITSGSMLSILKKEEHTY